MMNEASFAQGIRHLVLDAGFMPYIFNEVFSKTLTLDTLVLRNFQFETAAQQRAFVSSANERVIPLRNLMLVYGVFIQNDFSIRRLRSLRWGIAVIKMLVFDSFGFSSLICPFLQVQV